MVGLDKFKEAFAEFSENYVIIGGTACDIAMTGTVVRPRATHDIDMIVVVENMTPNLVKDSGILSKKPVIVRNDASQKPGSRQNTNCIVLSKASLIILR